MEQKTKFKLNLHIIFIVIIVLIAGVSAYKLYKWNQGTKSDYDPTADTSQFDIETLDMIIPMSSADLAGHEDDGELTILCLGDNPFSDDRGENGLAAKIAEKTGATVYNCAFPNSTVSCLNTSFDPEYSLDQFNLYYVTECIRNNDYSSIEAYASAIEDSNYINSVYDLQKVDMSKVDIILIMYDSTDYNMLRPVENLENDYDVSTYTGAMRLSLENLRASYPYARIFWMSHSYAQYQDENGNLSNGTKTDLGNGNLNHYLVKASDVAMDCGVSFVDNYYGTINEDNYESYMRDYLHYNEDGFEALANRISNIINNNLSTVEQNP